MVFIEKKSHLNHLPSENHGGNPRGLIPPHCKEGGIHESGWPNLPINDTALKLKTSHCQGLILQQDSRRFPCPNVWANIFGLSSKLRAGS